MSHKVRDHSISFPHSVNAMYSDSVKLSAGLSCLIVFALIKLPWSSIMYPVVDFRSFRSEAQSASQKAVSFSFSPWSTFPLNISCAV